MKTNRSQAALVGARLAADATWGGYRHGDRSETLGRRRVLSVAEAAARSGSSVRSVLRARRLIAVCARNPEAAFYLDLVEMGRMSLHRALPLAESHNELNRLRFGVNDAEA